MVPNNLQTRPARIWEKGKEMIMIVGILLYNYTLLGIYEHM